ncbi:MAG TPA: SDR family NAD(P)-dependent oxidoreductase [Acidimicrobiales bacterium]|nr:SDR family NAD(P)-dependent oxidoreductase [Acidimicrobiales bacterium]
MPASLHGASVVVVGGTSGIGLATAKMAQESGARVVVAGRDEQRLAASLEQLDGDVRGVTLDVADEEAVHALFASLDHVDHVATFAGTHVAGSVTDVDTATLRGPVDNRFWGPLYLCKYAAPKMTRGSITICTGAVSRDLVPAARSSPRPPADRRCSPAPWPSNSRRSG